MRSPLKSTERLYRVENFADIMQAITRQGCSSRFGNNKQAFSRTSCTWAVPYLPTQETKKIQGSFDCQNITILPDNKES